MNNLRHAFEMQNKHLDLRTKEDGHYVSAETEEGWLLYQSYATPATATEVDNTIKVGSTYRYHMGLLCIVDEVKEDPDTGMTIVRISFPCEDDEPEVRWVGKHWFSAYMDNGVRVFTLVEPEVPGMAASLP